MERMVKSKNLVILGMIGVIVFCGDVVVGQCPGIEGLITQCAMYVQKSGPQMNPSQQCCDQINNADASCVCKHLTKPMLHLIDVNKIIYVANSCGRPIPSGTKCGDQHQVLLIESYMKSPEQFIQHQVPPTKSNLKPSTQLVQLQVPPTKSGMNPSTQFMEHQVPPTHV